MKDSHDPLGYWAALAILCYRLDEPGPKLRAALERAAQALEAELGYEDGWVERFRDTEELPS